MAILRKIITLVVLVILPRYAVGATIDVYGTWEPFSISARSVTGPITVTPDLLIIHGEMRLQLRHPLLITYQAPVIEQTDAISFDVDGLSLKPLIHGNTLCRSAVRQAVFYLREDGYLVMVLSERGRPAMNSRYDRCGEYTYERSRDRKAGDEFVRIDRSAGERFVSRCRHRERVRAVPWAVRLKPAPWERQDRLTWLG